MLTDDLWDTCLALIEACLYFNLIYAHYYNRYIEFFFGSIFTSNFN